MPSGQFYSHPFKFSSLQLTSSWMSTSAQSTATMLWSQSRRRRSAEVYGYLRQKTGVDKITALSRNLTGPPVLLGFWYGRSLGVLTIGSAVVRREPVRAGFQ